jgi:hypothetical protein
MVDIAELGRAHLARALAGNMSHCIVSEWIDPDTGDPVKVYWRPLTGETQKKIDAFETSIERVCMTVKARALDENGKPIFKSTPIESLMHDFDFMVLRSIAYLMATDSGIDELIEDSEKE